jgi:hypothetical protein
VPGGRAVREDAARLRQRALPLTKLAPARDPKGVTRDATLSNRAGRFEVNDGGLSLRPELRNDLALIALGGVLLLLAAGALFYGAVAG